MRLIPSIVTRRTVPLMTVCAVAAVMFSSAVSLAVQQAPALQPAAKDANTGCGGSTGQGAKDKQAKPSEQQRPSTTNELKSTTDDVRLRWEIYTGNDYSH